MKNSYKTEYHDGGNKEEKNIYQLKSNSISLHVQPRNVLFIRQPNKKARKFPIIKDY